MLRKICVYVLVISFISYLPITLLWAEEKVNLCQYTQVSCSCSTTYPKGTEVTLTATPDPGSVFMEWSGDCTGKNPVVKIIMDKDKTCNAKFNLKPKMPTWRIPEKTKTEM